MAVSNLSKVNSRQIRNQHFGIADRFDRNSALAADGCAVAQPSDMPAVPAGSHG
jgi:hypothetical protein